MVNKVQTCNVICFSFSTESSNTFCLQTITMQSLNWHAHYWEIWLLSTVRSPQQLTQQKWRTSCAVTRVRYKISCVTHVWSTIYFTYAHPNVKNNNSNKLFWRYVSNNGALSLGYKLHQTILKQRNNETTMIKI